MPRHPLPLIVLLAVWIYAGITCFSVACADEDSALTITVPTRAEPVDFQREVLPILQRNCIACHSAAKPESELVLETPQTILKGGASGPAVVASKSAESLLLIYAAHQEEPFMPPPDNKVGAVALKPEELGLLKLWIDQGAKGEVKIANAAIAWQTLPPEINPIYSVTLSPDGQFAACGRANQIFVYHLPTGKLAARLTDPQLVSQAKQPTSGVAHLDLVQALAFDPSGELLASGGYKEVKLWRRPTNVRSLNIDAESVVQAVAVSPDGKRFATAGEDGVIRLWDAASGEAGQVLRGHAGPVNCVTFLADSSKLVSGSADKTVRVWNLDDAQLIGQIESPQPVTALAVLSGGKQVAVGGGDAVIRIWKIPSSMDDEADAPIELTGHSKPVTSLATLLGKDTQFISGSEDGTFRHWDIESKQQIRELKHGGPITAVAVRPDGQRFASAGSDKIIKLWNAADGKQLAEIKGDQRAHHSVMLATRAMNLAKSRHAAVTTALAAAEKDRPAKDEAKKKADEAFATAEKAFNEKTAAAKAAGTAKAAAETAIADVKASAGAAEAARAAVEKLSKLAANSGEQNHQDELTTAATESLKLAVAAKAAADKVLAESVKRNEPLLKAAEEADKALAEAEKAKTATQQAANVAAGDVKRAAELVTGAKTASEQADSAQKQAAATLEKAQQAASESERPWHALAFSPDNLSLAAGGDDQLVQTYSANDGRAFAVQAAGQQGNILALAFDPSGRIISGSAAKALVVWNPTPDWSLERTIGGVERSEFSDRVVTLDFSPNGKTLATGGGEPSRSGEIKLWNVADGSLIRALPDPHSDTVFGLAFSPDGKYLASASADKFVKVFTVADGKFVKSFEGHTNHVLDVAWKADGQVLASCSADNTVKIWNFETGEQQRTIQDFKKQVTSISFVGDTDNTLAASGDGTLRLHRIDRGQSVRSFSGVSDFIFSSAATYDGALVIAGGQDSVLRVWNGNDGKEVTSFKP